MTTVQDALGEFRGGQTPNYEVSEDGKTKEKRLFQSSHLEIIKVRHEDYPEHPYIYAHSPRTAGNLAAVLPYRITEDGDTQYLIRREVCPAWDWEHKTCALTGGWESDETILECAARELYEEAGYEVHEGHLESLGTCHLSKAMDTVCHLFAADVTQVDPDEPEGDGSLFEERAENEWTDSVASVEGPLVHVMVNRLLER